eukprot:gnl/TRDRNA2_/TRDRNA2_166971_c1_seq2.p1 gnl/TRDRNA2_/TRDRNA2_166971_c1~~gnl/TRDRNA2_/TRDRNA2_166971_c1_seq2.p1  ORF type:complete len:214 (-),score=24.61 gnl/TRDRNA2_/TRDRNA2_166971_c1_seq2:15-656(-)
MPDSYPVARLFDCRMKLLQAFTAREGHADIPPKHKEDGIALGTWLSQQRNAFHKGTLDEVRQSRLQQAGVTLDPAAHFFAQGLKMLLTFKDREGHINVPFRHRECDVPLGSWLAKQCKELREGTLDEDRRSQLEQAGIAWHPLAVRFETGLTSLLEFKGREGHCNVPRRHREGSIPLGKWLHLQRGLFRRGTLDTDMCMQLEEIGVVWARGLQ